MVNGRVLTCVFCGHEYPQDTPAWGNEVLTQHIAGCEHHPMRAVVGQRDRLRSALAALVGASTQDELQAVRIGLCALQIDPGEKAVLFEAVEALLESQ